MSQREPPRSGHASRSSVPASELSNNDSNRVSRPGATGLAAAALGIMETEYFVAGASDISSWETKIELGPGVDMSNDIQAVIARMRKWYSCIQGYSSEQVVFRTTWQVDLHPHRMVMRRPDGRIEPLPNPQNFPQEMLADVHKLQLAMRDEIKAGRMQPVGLLDFGAFMRMMGHYDPAAHPLNSVRQTRGMRDYRVRSTPRYRSTNRLRTGGQERGQPQTPPKADSSKRTREPKAPRAVDEHLNRLIPENFHRLPLPQQMEALPEPWYRLYRHIIDGSGMNVQEQRDEMQKVFGWLTDVSPDKHDWFLDQMLKRPANDVLDDYRAMMETGSDGCVAEDDLEELVY